MLLILVISNQLDVFTINDSFTLSLGTGEDGKNPQLSGREQNYFIIWDENSAIYF